MLERIYIDNFRGFSSFEWKPGRLVLIAGRNGSGKSSLFDAIDSIGMLLSGVAPKHELFPAEDFTRWDNRERQVFELDVDATVPDEPGPNATFSFRYRLVLDRKGKKGGLQIREETLALLKEQRPLFVFLDGDATLFGADGTPAAQYPAAWGRSALAAVPLRPETLFITLFKDAVRRLWWLAPLPPIIEALSGDESPTLDVDCENFPDWYRAVHGDSIKVTELNRLLADVLDGFIGLKLDDAGGDAKVLQAVFAAPGGKARSYDFDELSDGQRALIVLYALLVFGPIDDGVLMLDEPDNFLALREIQPWLRALEERLESGRGQVLLASHHPEVINRLWHEHGVIFDRDPEGPVRLRAMSEVPGQQPAETMARGEE